MKIYYNPRCSTSRKALQMLTDAGIEYEIVLYLNDPLSSKKLSVLLRKLKKSPLDLKRKKKFLNQTTKVKTFQMKSGFKQ